MLARDITGELGKIGNGGVNVVNNTLILNSPAFAQLQTVILSALGPFPDARVAVVAALRSIEETPPILIEAQAHDEEHAHAVL